MIAESIDHLGLSRKAVAVARCRGLSKQRHDQQCYLPKMEVDPDTYEVRADGELLTCEPAQRTRDDSTLFSLLNMQLIEHLPDPASRETADGQGARYGGHDLRGAPLGAAARHYLGRSRNRAGPATGTTLEPGAIIAVEANWYLQVEAATEAVLAVRPRDRDLPCASLSKSAIIISHWRSTAPTCWFPTIPRWRQLLDRLGEHWERRCVVFNPIAKAHRHVS